MYFRLVERQDNDFETILDEFYGNSPIKRKQKTTDGW